MRASISTDNVPISATMKRQPNGFIPNSHSPTAITHLPPGGCTTYEGLPAKTSLKSPARMRWLARSLVLSSPLTKFCSTPNFSSENASFA